VALLLADGVDNAGEDLAVAGGASVLRGLLVSSAQLLVFVVEVTTSGIGTTVGICIYNREGFESGLDLRSGGGYEEG
jgi:hypothetical protein